MDAVIILNLSSNLGGAKKKWKQFAASPVGEALLDKNLPILHTKKAPNPGFSNQHLEDSISDFYERGARNFIACGGDGTVNLLVNAIQKLKLKDVVLGAVGIGSCNDFHRPYLKRKNPIPVKLNFNKSILYDLVSAQFVNASGEVLSHYFISSSSIGVVANGAFGLYKPSGFLSVLKFFQPSLAVYWAGICAVLKNKNMKARVTFDGASEKLALTTLAIVKNNYFGGDMSYDLSLLPDDGFLGQYTTWSLSKMQLIRLMAWVSRGRFTGFENSKSQKVASCRIKAEEPFVVELDGEIIDNATEVQFSVVPKAIAVCEAGNPSTF